MELKMDRSEFIAELQKEIRQNFMSLSEDEQDIVRANKGSDYANLLRKIIPEELWGGLTTKEHNNKPLRKRGLATR
tara:strand:- start:20 stop:247 length:228 start_codon:yes stop_codon:yes gene_type:complete